MHNHLDAANAAILESIWDDHPDFDQKWLNLVPADAPLNYSDEQAWREFAGRVVARFRHSIATCTCPDADSFFGHKSDELRDLREALRSNVQCD